MVNFLSISSSFTFNSFNRFRRFPFDVKNPLGYSLADAVQFIIAVNIDAVTVCIFTIVVAPSLVLISTADDVKCGLGILNTCARTKESEFEITHQFNCLVRFHAKTKQLSEQIFNFCQFNLIIFHSSKLQIGP